MESDIDPYDGSENWIDALLENPAHREAVAREVEGGRGRDRRRSGVRGRGSGPDEEARRRFREFAKKRLETS